MVRFAVMLMVLLAAQALAASGIEALRANAENLRGEVAQLKASQLSTRGELSTLSARIEALKASQKGPLTAGSELDVALKRSQDLSAGLTDLAQQVTAKDASLTAARVALLEGLTAEMGRLRTEFDATTDRARRSALIASMRSLRTERESLRVALPAASVPALAVLKPTDDPEQLLEQADLVRDNQEKVRRELKALESRIAERRAEVELDRRMQRFMSDESMFDDQDRRLRVREVSVKDGTQPPLAGVGGTKEADSAADVSLTAGPNGFGGFAPQAANAEASRSSFAPDSTGAVKVTRADDARVQPGEARGSRSGDDDVDDLEVQRVRLQKLAEQLEHQAKQLESRASDLK